MWVLVACASLAILFLVKLLGRYLCYLMFFARGIGSLCLSPVGFLAVALSFSIAFGALSLSGDTDPGATIDAVAWAIIKFILLLPFEIIAGLINWLV